MPPRPHDHLTLPAGNLRSPSFPHAHVAVDGALGEDIEPAAEVVHRNRDFLELFGCVELLPVVVVVGMPDPLVVELRLPAQQPLHVQQRQVPDHPVVAEVVRAAIAPVETGVLSDARLLTNRAPAKVEGKPPATVEGHEVVIGAGGGHVGEDGDQVRRGLLGCLPLHQAQIGFAQHAHLAVGPGLAGRPLDGVVAVLGLVAKRVPTPLRFISCPGRPESRRHSPAWRRIWAPVEPRRYRACGPPAPDSGPRPEDDRRPHKEWSHPALERGPGSPGECRWRGGSMTGKRGSDPRRAEPGQRQAQRISPDRRALVWSFSRNSPCFTCRSNNSPLPTLHSPLFHVVTPPSHATGRLIQGET